MPEFISSLIAALLSWWRGRNRQAEQQEAVVSAYREESKLEAQPDKPWKQTVDDL